MKLKRRPARVPPDAPRGMECMTVRYMFMATMSTQSSMGPNRAPWKPRQKTPPAIASPVRNGWPPLQARKVGVSLAGRQALHLGRARS